MEEFWNNKQLLEFAKHVTILEHHCHLTVNIKRRFFRKIFPEKICTHVETNAHVQKDKKRASHMEIYFLREKKNREHFKM